MRGIGPIEINGGKGEASHVELIHRLQGDKKILLVGCQVRPAAELVDFFADAFGASGHHLGVKTALLAAAIEISTVEGQRLMCLEPGDSKGHHDIGHGVSLGEKISNFAGGFDPPVGNLHLTHQVLCIAGEAAALFHLSFSDCLHGFEGEGRLHALTDEIDHNVITAADGIVD